MNGRKLSLLYSLVRIITGIVLVIHGAHNAFSYGNYMQRVEVYFSKLEYFNFPFLYSNSPFVPFEEFAIGLFLIMGFYTRKVLWIAMFSYTFLILFMLDAEAYNLVAFHVLLVAVFVVLDYTNQYDGYPLEKILTLPT